MKAVLFYGVPLPVQLYVDGAVPDDYAYVFDENFVGSDWQIHTRRTDGCNSLYLCLVRLSVTFETSEAFRQVSPRGLQEQKLKPDEREELKDILKALGVNYASPKWFLTASE